MISKIIIKILINYLNIRKEWIPYFHCKDEKIWRGKFDHFFSMTNFGPAISPGLVVKMTNALVKEVRVGIAAARSGMNLQTRFKKKNEQINIVLRKYLDYLEDYSLDRMTDKMFKMLKQDWKDMIKTRIPKFYRMEAKTLYYNFYELEIIRRSMTEDIESFFNSKTKNLMFATSAKVYPYLNQVVSVRIILAKFYRIAEEDILPEHLKEYKEDLASREQEIKEEEDSFEDEIDDWETPTPDKDTDKGKDKDKDKKNGTTKGKGSEDNSDSDDDDSEEEVDTNMKNKNKINDEKVGYSEKNIEEGLKRSGN